MTPVNAETRFTSCYGCAKCTSGCPVADQMDVKPHRLVRMLVLGETEPLLEAASPWQCVGCQTCLARCPNDVDIPAAMAQVREAALAAGRTGQAGTVPLFDRLFLDMVRRRGRVNEGLLTLRYGLRAGGLLRDWRMALKMLRRGKLGIGFDSVADRPAVARLFETDDTAAEGTP